MMMIMVIEMGMVLEIIVNSVVVKILKTELYISYQCQDNIFAEMSPLFLFYYL
jgi:vancomycin permeability regulator SanA